MRRLRLSLLAYAASAALDHLTTLALSEMGYAESNPRVAAVLGTPLHAALELAFLALVTAMALLARAALLRAGQPDRSWLVPLAPAAVRFSGFLHNILLAAAGWKSPLAALGATLLP